MKTSHTVRLKDPTASGDAANSALTSNSSSPIVLNCSKKGDLALITKQKPKNMTTAFVEAYTDADNYTIKFNNDVHLTGAQKATVLASQLLADYMYFNGNTKKFKEGNIGLTIYCFYCSIIGLIMPCCLYLPKHCGGGADN
mmetsp:Transcript_17945/g.25845  ORF Transcript_17945/g.25845 Transcript_17945/m.25845 type:complete len:141 (+) Transcript_17945:1229-1651(+)